MRPASATTTLARYWVPERSLVTDTGLVIVAAAAVVLPAGWRLSRSR